VIEAPHAVAVDAAGDIFAYVGGQGVVEFRASGEFVRVFSGSETPGIGESGAGTFGGSVEGVAVVFYNATAGIIAVDNVSLTIWGVPGSPAHDPLRVHSLGGGLTEFGTPPGGLEAPYLSNPTACGAGQLDASFAVTSWQHPGESPPATAMPFGPVVGCDRLGMAPSLSAEVTSSAASAPTGATPRAPTAPSTSS